MKISHNIKAISRILLILLLILAMIIGSIFSYLLVIGYYINLESNIPENPTLSITETNFDPENAGTFNITVLNPTYSSGGANITEISIATVDNTIHHVSNTEPQLPSTLKKGEEKTFTCTWNWGNFTGEIIKVIVLVEDGSGSTYAIKTDNAKLTIATVFSTFNMQQFNITLTNPSTSAIDLRVTDITLTTEDESTFDVDIINQTLPQIFFIGLGNTFQCLWDWTEYLGTEITISVFTLQNITFYHTEKLPQPSRFTFTNISFDTNDTTSFNVTVEISDPTINSANITAFGIVFQNQTSLPLTVASQTTLPYYLPANTTATFELLWNWEFYRGETVTIGLETEPYETEERYYGYTVYTVP